MDRRAFLATLGLTGCYIHNEPNKEEMQGVYHCMLNSAAIVPIPDNPGDDYAMFLDFTNITSMMKEARSVGPITNVTADADPVGFMYDRGRAAFNFSTASNSNRPTLGSDVNMASFLTFGGTVFKTAGTTSYLKRFHESSPVWSCQMWVKMNGGNATAITILNTGISSSLHAGFWLRRTAANKIEVNVYKAVSGQNVCFYASTKTLTTTDGWMSIQVELNGTGTGTGRLIMKGVNDVSSTTETFNVGTGSTANCTDDLQIGGDTNLSIGGHFILRNRVLTAQEVSDFQNIAQYSRSSTDFIPVLQWNVDFNESSRIYSDSGKTVTITDGGNIRAIESGISSKFAAYVREFISSSDASSPKWRQSVLNSKSVAEWVDDADNETLTSNPEQVCPELCGKWTMVMVVKNDDDTNGSHILSYNGDPYIPVTGKNYSGNLVAGNPYTVVHGYGAAAVNAISLKNIDTYNVIVIRRDGQSWKSWTGNNLSVTGTMADFFNAERMGNPSIVGWRLNGKVALFKKWIGLLTDLQVTTLINQLNSTYAI